MRDTITVMLADDNRSFQCISRNTVENHRANIVCKTGVLAQVGLTTEGACIGLSGLDL